MCKLACQASYNKKLYFNSCRFLTTITFAANCFPDASWPKLIGYGLADTKIHAVARSSSTGELALALRTSEADLVGNLGSSYTLSVTVFNPTTESYNWYKVLDNISAYASLIIYTPDGSKIFTSFKTESTKHIYYQYLDAADGSFKGSFRVENCCGHIKTKDTIVI